MNLEEHARLWKKPRKLFDIDVDEITLCGSAATRKKFFIKKMEDSMTKDFSEAMSLVEEFIADDDLEKSKIDATKLKKAMQTLVAFRSDLYPELRNAISVFLRWATGDKIKKNWKSDRSSIIDNCPSIPIAAPEHIISKMIDRMDGKDGEDDEGADE